jgi:sortase (surface protein transpeptidase)
MTPSAVPSVTSSSLALSRLGAASRDDPVRLTVASQQIAGPVVPVGTDPTTHSLRVPATTTEIAWWSYGSRPGDTTGPVVLAAHVDYDGRLGLFYRLDRVAIGSRVTVTRRDGTSVTYRVASRQHVLKRSLDSLGLLGTGGRPRRVLVTCGGSFDAATRSYRDNVVVTASPVG